MWKMKNKKECWIYSTGFTQSHSYASCCTYSHRLVIFWCLSNLTATKSSIPNLRPDHSKAMGELYLGIPLVRQIQRNFFQWKKNLFFSSISSTGKWTTLSQMPKLKIRERLCSFSFNLSMSNWWKFYQFILLHISWIYSPPFSSPAGMALILTFILSHKSRSTVSKLALSDFLSLVHSLSCFRKDLSKMQIHLWHFPA